MKKLAPVEEAKALFNEAREWGTWRWLTEKRRVRTAADVAWEALEEVEKGVKASWNDDLRKAYRCKRRRQPMANQRRSSFTRRPNRTRRI